MPTVLTTPLGQEGNREQAAGSTGGARGYQAQSQEARRAPATQGRGHPSER